MLNIPAQKGKHCAVSLTKSKEAGLTEARVDGGSQDRGRESEGLVKGTESQLCRRKGLQMQCAARWLLSGTVLHT
jgi:hypothetical protein